ncbi:uncharacterized protein EKO05_0005967 [Ascochyta rabiei]|uniref:uncharacterized protein n=1 Tax=Didymella rabiei TaxID=5454 RepID=UPI00220EC605|nr:uncharacterized protein EKO05_0005967 [Ascochyta rabiei]UPX15522.1 hypothetical protein EKO05_0005967 [Ascochyta rabiei]
MSSIALGPLPQSADKQLLFSRLGLNEQVHKMLLGEAQAARDRLSRNQINLTDQSRADPLVTAPYKWDEISETAKHYEILTVVNNAGPQTRPYYGMGRHTTNVSEESWVARWYLWHSFRYRDNRDHRPRTGASSGNQAYGGKYLPGELETS